MSEHLTRRDLKTDNVAVAVESTVDYFGHHRQTLIRAAVAVVAAAVVVTGVFWWLGHAKEERQADLVNALQVSEATVGPPTPAGGLSYPTQDAKDSAVAKAFTDLAAKDHGSNEGAIAEYNLAGIAAANGKNEEARRHYLAAIDDANKEYASLAKLALADLDFSDNHAADGEKLLRELMDKPTTLVSKEQATISLAQHIAKTQPAEAKRLLEPLRANAGAVGQTATSAYNEITGK